MHGVCWKTLIYIPAGTPERRLKAVIKKSEGSPDKIFFCSDFSQMFCFLLFRAIRIRQMRQEEEKENHFSVKVLVHEHKRLGTTARASMEY